ncbi:CTP synthetase [Defluviimonas sp. WL0002]|uniref:CTP synthetase n=1 Tax=Albidovulum marisflavi TaxID=2984159 RepID=A0ABT2ZBB0_9RHOB|nr:CTP synthetase [Defluviimonas sp. WL0002]MCV2868368.1 CTP synthetase [Defluviimonas sp. WL0002]
MLRLFFIIYTLAATVLAGSAIVAVLTMEMPGYRPIIVAAALGAIAAVPLAYGVARRLIAA